MKALKTLVMSLMLVLSLSAHADMDFAYGLATGLPTGSASSMLGATIHNMNDTSDSRPSQSTQVQVPAQSDSPVVATIKDVVFLICLVGIALFFLLIIALSIVG